MYYSLLLIKHRETLEVNALTVDDLMKRIKLDFSAKFFGGMI